MCVVSYVWFPNTSFIFSQLFLYFFFHFSFVSLLFLFLFCSFFSFFFFFYFSISPVMYGLWSLGVIVKCQACTSKWKTQSQDVGAAEKFQPHGTLMGDSSPKGPYLNTKMRSHPKSSKLLHCQTFYAKPLAKYELKSAV